MEERLIPQSKFGFYLALAENARSGMRLILIAFLTLHVLTLNLIGKYFRKWGYNPHVLAQVWAKRMLKVLGIALDQTGICPHGTNLIVCNHRSYIDILVVLSLFPAPFLAKEEISRWPLLGRGARFCKTIFVNRDLASSRRRARSLTLNYLKRGQSVVAFPEGTTTRYPKILPFKYGLFVNAARHDIPVVPVAIEYEKPDLAWVEDDDFVSHFIRVFKKKQYRAMVAIGQPRVHTNPQTLKESTEEWISLQSSSFYVPRRTYEENENRIFVSTRSYIGRNGLEHPGS